MLGRARPSSPCSACRRARGPTGLRRSRGLGGQAPQGGLTSVRAGSEPQRSSKGSTGHQRSPTVRGTAGRRRPSSHSWEDAARRFRLWSRRSGRRRRGSRWAATGVRNDRGTHPRTVEDHDRRFCRRRPLTWRFSRDLPGPQYHAIPCRNARYRSRTEEVT
jgi:hypothetical protein